MNAWPVIALQARGRKPRAVDGGKKLKRKDAEAQRWDI